jgi:hypothetical protein
LSRITYPSADAFTNNIAEEVNFEDDDELELLGPLILDDMPDFRLQTEMTDSLQLEEIIDSDEDLSQALHAIEEANTGTVADDVNQPRAQSSRFAQLDHDQKENIVMETESAATKRQTKYGVQICRRRYQILADHSLKKDLHSLSQSHLSFS